MKTGVLQRLVDNSKRAIQDRVYDDRCADRQNSGRDMAEIVQDNKKTGKRTVITEIKFSSPSLGEIVPSTSLDSGQIARQMVAGGTSAISVLTQPYLFNGSPERFITVRDAVPETPMLMKDIVVDYAQLDAASAIGADYVLLIQALFDGGYVKHAGIHDMIDHAHKRGTRVLLEVHTVKEMQAALETDADVIGVNNRNLDTLGIDLGTTETILAHVKNDDELTAKLGKRPLVSESGINTIQDVQYLERCGADAFLIGTSVMKSSDVCSKVRGMVHP